MPHGLLTLSLVIVTVVMIWTNAVLNYIVVRPKNVRCLLSAVSVCGFSQLSFGDTDSFIEFGPISILGDW
jgi:hypothetical protein